MSRLELLLRTDWLKNWPGHVTRVEPTIGSTDGAPDCHLVADGFDPGWLEFKALDENGRFKLRPAQRLWMKQFLPFSRRVAICVMSEEGWWVIPIRDMVARPYQRTYSLEDFPPSQMAAWPSTPYLSLPLILECAYA